mmetsp:Transcript_6942/g.10156  ORF Transcript_6942/g.10156 Transcript_6942/m.10156 type:complete len:129 (-) Transcript_6942:32-418(-)
MRSSIPPSKSLSISFFLVIGLFVAVQALKPLILSIDALKIGGGFLCSLIYLFTVTGLGSFYQRSHASADMGLMSCLFALFFALGVAISIHGVCFTTCGVFSVLITYELMMAGPDGESSSTTTSHKKRK